MKKAFLTLANRVCDFIRSASPAGVVAEPRHDLESSFNSLALELFALQFAANAPYRRLCTARRLSPDNVEHWTRIPAMPTASFKDAEVTCLAATERSAVFHSSGTTQHRPGRHFHSQESLAVYEASLLPWFQAWVRSATAPGRVLCLTPEPAQVPHSSLAHMFGVIRRALPDGAVVFAGRLAADGGWALEEAVAAQTVAEAQSTQAPLTILATAFSLVNWLDELAESGVAHSLPAGSVVMETGGYKGRSRSLPRAELHALITGRLGVPPQNIVCEYGMSELSSQAYAVAGEPPERRVFHFPPWARAQVVSPETGALTSEGEAGLLRVLDLANVFSVAAIQTEDLAVRRGEGFELFGRAAQAEPRGCSLLAVG